MRRLGLALLLALWAIAPAHAQTKFTMPPPAGVAVAGYQVVTSCGAASGLAAGNTAFGAMDTTGAICTNATGGGGGGAVTIANGADVALGSTTDSPCAVPTSATPCTLSAVVKALTNTAAGPGKVSGSYGAAQLSHQVISFSSSGNNIVITRAVGTIKVYELELSCASTLTTIIPQDGTSTDLGAKLNVGSIFEPLQTEPLYTTTGTNNFVINLSSGVSCRGFAKYLDS